MATGEREGGVISNDDKLAAESELDCGYTEVYTHTAAPPPTHIRFNSRKFNQYEYYTDLCNQILGNLHMLALLDRGEQVKGGQCRSPIPLLIALSLQIDQYVIFFFDI